MKLIKKNGSISKFGARDNIFSEALCDKIRTRLKLTKKELPNNVIKKVINIGNIELGEFIINNPEGFLLNKMGALAASKHLPKEFRDDKEDIIERIKKLEISELRRHQVLQRYQVDVGRRLDYSKILTLQKQLPHLNMNTFFYTFRIMWFNKRNCITKKAPVYVFKPSNKLNRKFADKIWEGADFFQWDFTQWYGHKTKAVY